MKKTLIIFASLIGTMNCVASQVGMQKDPYVITNFDEFTHNWAHAIVKELNKEELELLGTFLYYSVATSQYELSMRNALLDLQRGAQIFSFQLVSLIDPQETLTICSKLSALLGNIEKELAPSRNYFLAAWQLCNKEIAQNPHSNLCIVIEQLQKLCKNSLNYWAREKKNEIENLLENSSDKLEDSLQQLIIFKNALQDIIDGNYPLPEPNSDCLEIQTVHNSLAVASGLYEMLFKTSIATDEITALSFNLIHLNTQIFGALYQAFYAALEEQKLTPMHIVINEQGFISPEARRATLPHIVIESGKLA